MCGIAGILYKDRLKNDPSRLRSMTDAMQHRGPDAAGYFVEGPIALGHRRLSIIDLSAASNQPFASANGRYTMVFNGELFNFQEVRKTLTDHSFKSNGDTEVLIESFARQGIKCLDSLKGFFAFAIWDKETEKLCIGRDRMGVKPLYYYESHDCFIFSSEIRSILATGLVKSEIDELAVYDFLSYQSVSSPSCIIKGINQLEAGSYLEVENGKLTISTYWDLLNISQEHDYSDKKQVTKNIRSLLQEAVTSRLISDVPIGAFLSGGIDSSIVVGLMAAASTSRVETFNVSFSEKEYDESEYADTIARKFNTNHHPIFLKPEIMLSELENALQAMDSPSGDGINTYVVSKAVRNAGLTVALSGVGGDELFAGYPFFPKYKKLRNMSGLWSGTYPIRKLVSALTNPASKGYSNKASELLKVKSATIADLYPLIRNILSDSQVSYFTNIAGQHIAPVESKLALLSSRIEQFPELSQVSIAEFLGYTQQTLLKDTDQMSMAVSLEVREPFFDHSLVEYVLGIPDQFKYPNYPKQLLVESVEDLLPHEIVHRKKQGFSFPWAIWMKTALRDFCEGYINKASSRVFINGAHLKSYWQRFLAGDPNIRWMELWLFVILEYWMEKNAVE